MPLTCYLLGAFVYPGARASLRHPHPPCPHETTKTGDPALSPRTSDKLKHLLPRFDSRRPATLEQAVLCKIDQFEVTSRGGEQGDGDR